VLEKCTAQFYVSYGNAHCPRSGSLLPQGERLLAGAMDEWDSSKYGGNFGTIYSPTRRQTRTNKVPLQRWAPPLSRIGAGLRACQRAAARPLPFLKVQSSGSPLYRRTSRWDPKLRRRLMQRVLPSVTCRLQARKPSTNDPFPFLSSTCRIVLKIPSAHRIRADASNDDGNVRGMGTLIWSCRIGQNAGGGRSLW